MSNMDYQYSKILSLKAHEGPGNAFMSLLFALIREAGTEEGEALERAFPLAVREFHERFYAPAGILLSELIKRGTQVRTRDDRYGFVDDIDYGSGIALVRFWLNNPRGWTKPLGVSLPKEELLQRAGEPEPVSVKEITPYRIVDASMTEVLHHVDS